MKRILLGLFVVLAFTSIDVQAQNPSAQDIEQSILKSDVEFDIYFLASDEFLGRDTGTQELKIASRYIATRFQQYGMKAAPGLDGYYQHVPFRMNRAPESIQMSVLDSTFTLNRHLVAMSPYRGDTEADVVVLEYGSQDEISNHELNGKIVIAKAGLQGDENPQQLFQISAVKRAQVAEAGGTGLIEIYQNQQLPWQTLAGFMNRDQLSLDTDSGSTNEETSPIPHLWMNGLAGDIDMFLSGIPGETISLSVKGEESRTFYSRNVVGIIEGSDTNLKDEYILLSAHYDHTGTTGDPSQENYINNGARDNAVGTAGILAAAKYLSENPPRRSVIVAAWTAEEKGLLGSGYYAENPPIPLHQTVYNLNIDGAGYNDITKVTVIGLGRTEADDDLKASAEAFGLEAIPDPVPEQNLFNRSDNVHFARAGIPSPTYSMGLTAFDDEINKYYHRPTDEPHTVDYEYVTAYIRSYVMAATLIGNADKAPFWLAGDEYEQAGLELYNFETENY
ncbi:M28 family peptidase [Rhodohalobacter halophilus]|uniref:M28 family peptidase n=1 Tax=Rhodohalobacter halophilus TaxID=1812810 RepID=UPI0015B47083|nr:M28 family peptidase [Rhodohalobacter halophilus]